MRNEDEEIDRLNDSNVRKLLRRNMKMISQVGREKRGRDDEGRDHEIAVKASVIFFDRNITREQKQSCNRIQRGIKAR